MPCPGSVITSKPALLKNWRQRAAVWAARSYRQSGAVRNAASSLALEQDVGVETFVLLNSQWNFGGSVLLQTPYIDDRELGDGTPLERQGSWGTGWFFNSDSRKPVSLGAYADLARGAPRYERSYDFGVTVNVRPLAQLETTLDVAFIRGDGTIRQIRKATPLPGGCSTACPEPAELDPATATQQPPKSRQMLT